MIKNITTYTVALFFVLALVLTNRAGARVTSYTFHYHSVTDSTEIDKPLTKSERREAKRRAKRGEDISTDTLKSNLPFSELKGIEKVKYLVDSLREKGVTVDSITIDSIARHYFSDTLVVKGGVLPKLNTTGSLSNARILDSLIYAEALELGKKDEKKERINIFRDTVSFGRMSTLAIAFPGYGQIYNKQYWKLPMLYGSVAGLTYAGVKLGQRSSHYKNLFNTAIADGKQEDVDRYYAKHRDYTTASTLLYVGAGLTYMYFLADGAFNYKGKEDSKNRATYLAFMFPGAGQIYNKQYWKLPIVYGGFATFAYIINFNGRGYTRYNNAYQAVLNGETDEFNGTISEEVLMNTKNNFRRARDMAIIYTFGFYLVTVVDAYVAASFKQYDISDDLSLQVAPSINVIENGFGGAAGSYGMSLRFTF